MVFRSRCRNESARRSIHIIDHKLNDPAIQALLKSKKAQGLDVRTLGLGQLGGLLPHGKLIIVDGRTVKDRLGLSDPVTSASQVFVLQALSGG